MGSKGKKLESLRSEIETVMIEAFGNVFRSFLEEDNQRKMIRRAMGRETSRMGNITESIVANNLPWFMNRYFDVSLEAENVFRQIPTKNPNRKNPQTGEDQEGEIDVLAVNDNAVVVVEAKTTVMESDIYHFRNIINELSCLELDSSRARHKELRGVNLKGKEIYGGIAFLGTTVDTTENQIIGVIEKSELFGMKIMGKNSVELCATGLKRSLSKQTTGKHPSK